MTDSQRMISTLDSLAPLQQHFNEIHGTHRLIVLLSPTCPGCQYGAAAIRHILGEHSNHNLATAVVWIPMLDGDTDETLAQAAAEFDGFEVVHFADPEHIAGGLFAKMLGFPDSIAWDCYLLYDGSVKWHDSPPKPTGWAHQLSIASGAPPENYRCGDDLTAALQKFSSQMSW